MIGSRIPLMYRGVTRRVFSSVVKVEGGATAPALAAPVKASPPAAPSSNGSTFFQRFSSFLTGCGVGFAASAYFIYNELEDSNRAFERDISQLKAQIAALQK